MSNQDNFKQLIEGMLQFADVFFESADEVQQQKLLRVLRKAISVMEQSEDDFAILLDDFMGLANSFHGRVTSSKEQERLLGVLRRSYGDFSLMAKGVTELGCDLPWIECPDGSCALPGDCTGGVGVDNRDDLRVA
jgi:hypothetical protein